MTEVTKQTNAPLPQSGEESEIDARAKLLFEALRKPDCPRDDFQTKLEELWLIREQRGYFLDPNPDADDVYLSEYFDLVDQRIKEIRANLANIREARRCIRNILGLEEGAEVVEIDPHIKEACRRIRDNLGLEEGAEVVEIDPHHPSSEEG